MIHMKIEVEDSLVTILKLRRKQLKISQEDLGKKLGLSAMGLSYLENENRGLKVDLLELWARELGLEVEIKLSIKQ